MPSYPDINVPPVTDPDRFEALVADLVERDRTEVGERTDARRVRGPEEADVCFESEDSEEVRCVLCETGSDPEPRAVEDRLDALADADREVAECVVAATAPRNERLESAVEARSGEREAAGGLPFPVRLLAWGDVERLLADREAVFEERFPERYRDHRTARETGFIRLTDADFDGRRVAPSDASDTSAPADAFSPSGASGPSDAPASPESWQTGFTFPEVAAGEAFERWHDDAGGLVSDDLVERLGDGEDQVVVGPPGSGKSTTCKSVANEWHDRELGTVFYRRGEARARFGSEDAAALGDRIDRANGHVLVVVEDATEPDAEGVSDLLDRYRDAPDVTFLLDSRTRDWRDAGELALDSRQSAVNHEGLREYEVPRVTADEFGALVAHFEERFGAEVATSSDRLHEALSPERVTVTDFDGQSSGVEISTPSRPFAGTGGPSARIGELLLLAYRLAGGRETDGDGRGDEGEDGDAAIADALKASVAAAYREVADTDLDLTVGLLVNVLSAAGVEVSPGLVHALGDDRADHRRVGEALARLEGTLVFPDGTGRYRTRHEQWSELFLEHAADRLGDEAVGRFEECVNAVFALVDSPERREELAARFGRGGTLLDAIDAEPRATGDALVRRVFEVGLRRPTLAPLFGTTDESGIEVSTACSPTTRIDAINWRGQMYLDGGEFKRAADEFEQLGDRVDRADALDDDRADEIRAWKFNNLGNVATARDDLDAAEDYYLRAVNLLYDLDADRSLATTISNLGDVTERRGDLDAAETYYQRSRDLSCKLDDERGRARSLNDLGNVADARGDYAAAEDYYRQSFELLRDLGDEHGKATTLNNIGNVARACGDYAAAADYYQRSYATLLPLVDGRGQAQSLGNLGVVARSRGDLDAATDYYQRSLNLMRDLDDEHGEATSLNNLGNVARSRGDLDAAEEYYRRSLDIKRKLDDERGEATSLNNLGNVAQARGDLDAAEDYYRQSLAIKRDLGDDHGAATSLNNLGLVAREQGDYEAAREHFEDAADVLLDAGTIDEALTVLDNAIDACRRVGDESAAIDHCETALDLAADADVEERHREFRRTYAHLSGRDPEESTMELYRLAFTHVLDTEPMAAILRFAETWERRSAVDPDSAAYEKALDAGVYLAAHFRLLEGGDPADELPDPDEVLDAVADERDRLSLATEPLFERFADGGTDSSATDLYKLADESEDDLFEREAQAAAILLENLD